MSQHTKFFDPPDRVLVSCTLDVELCTPSDFFLSERRWWEIHNGAGDESARGGCGRA